MSFYGGPGVVGSSSIERGPPRAGAEKATRWDQPPPAPPSTPPARASVEDPGLPPGRLAHAVPDIGIYDPRWWWQVLMAARHIVALAEADEWPVLMPRPSPEPPVDHREKRRKRAQAYAQSVGGERNGCPQDVDASLFPRTRGGKAKLHPDGIPGVMAPESANLPVPTSGGCAPPGGNDPDGYVPQMVQIPLTKDGQPGKWCSYHLGSGHSSEECRQYRRGKAPSKSATEQCFGCGDPGHKVRTCPLKSKKHKMNEESSSGGRGLADILNLPDNDLDGLKPEKGNPVRGAYEASDTDRPPDSIHPSKERDWRLTAATSAGPWDPWASANNAAPDGARGATAPAHQ